jgi:uncharacterized membrane protein YphA (DoxX/SURF4 family)
MKFILMLTDAHAAFGRLLERFRSLLLLGTRVWVVWPFWQGTLSLTAGVATLGAAAGRSAEIMVALLVSLGLFARVGALGGLALAWLALPPGGLSTAHTHDRYLLSLFMLLVLAIFGPGRIAVDAWLERRSAARCRPATAALAR